MSYFTYASTEYDLPHPTLSRHQPRFYIPDRSTYSPGQSSTALPGENLGYHSRHPSALSSVYSGQSTPYYRPNSLYGSGSRGSLTALRHALHRYHASAGGNGSHSPHPQATPHAGCACPAPQEAHQNDCQAVELYDDHSNWNPDAFGVAGEPMEALIDIHRVLYRGMEEPGAESSPEWAEQGKEVKRVVERWFEGDCVYDHPLIRLSSRQSVLTHFALLQLLSTAYVPSLTPSSILLHARNLTSRIRGAVLGTDDLPGDVARTMSAKGKQPAVDPVDQWLATSNNAIDHRNYNSDGWWKLWDVSAECRDIGCMECYEGYHIALIDHVVSLTLFPSIIRRPSNHLLTPHLLSPAESTDSLTGEPRSFVHSLAASVLREFDFLLHWDLPISTIVEFNEVGKATHVRDVVDVQDVIDTFVPGAKRFSWLSRRVAGLVTSTVGSIALNFIPGHTILVGDAEHLLEEHRDVTEGEATEKIKEIETAKAANNIPGEFPFPDMANSLGLEGVSSISMAPDVDGAGQDT